VYFLYVVIDILSSIQLIIETMVFSCIRGMLRPDVHIISLLRVIQFVSHCFRFHFRRALPNLFSFALICYRGRSKPLQILLLSCPTVTPPFAFFDGYPADLLFTIGSALPLLSDAICSDRHLFSLASAFFRSVSGSASLLNLPGFIRSAFCYLPWYGYIIPYFSPVVNRFLTLTHDFFNKNAATG